MGMNLATSRHCRHRFLTPGSDLDLDLDLDLEVRSVRVEASNIKSNGISSQRLRKESPLCFSVISGAAQRTSSRTGVASLFPHGVNS